jgi:hypothetical protein
MGSHSPPAAADGVAAGRRVAGVLLANRHEAALHLLNSISDWPRWRSDIAAASGTEGSIDFFQPVLFVFVDYLSLSFATGDPVWKQLYVGEKLKLISVAGVADAGRAEVNDPGYGKLQEPGMCGEANQHRRQQLAVDDQRGLLAVFGRKLPAGDFAQLERGLADITSLLTTRPEHSVRVLLIGDFLQLDVLGLLYAELLEARIALEPTCVANPNAAELHAALRGLAGQGFDFIFHTPLSNLDCPAIAGLHGLPGMLANGRSISELADAQARQASATVDLARTLWACPIIVNNASAVLRHEDRLGAWLRNHFTRRVRRQFCTHVNRQLGELVQSNGPAGTEMSIFDEHALLSAEDEWALGRMLRPSEQKHPIVLGQRIAAGYRKLIVAKMGNAGRSPQQLVGREDRAVGAGQAVDPIQTAALG